jgi:hypothetical protein
MEFHTDRCAVGVAADTAFGESLVVLVRGIFRGISEGFDNNCGYSIWYDKWYK